MGEHERGAEGMLDLLETFLDGNTLGREEPVTKTLDLDRHRFHPGEERVGTRLGLVTAAGIAAEDDPAHLEIGPFLLQPQQRAAATDLDVIGMGAETKEPERRCTRPKSEAQHRASPTAPAATAILPRAGAPVSSGASPGARPPKGCGLWHKAPRAPANP